MMNMMSLERTLIDMCDSVDPHFALFDTGFEGNTLEIMDEV